MHTLIGVQEADKVKSTSQYVPDGKQLHCCQKQFTSEITKQQKMFNSMPKKSIQYYTLMQKKFTFLMKN